MRRPKKLDPKTQWIVSNSSQPVAPAFYREELRKVVDEVANLEAKVREVSSN